MQIDQVATVVVPTLGRPALATLLGSLDRAAREAGTALPTVVVDDRTGAPPLHLDAWPHLASQLLAGDGRGPAHARNVGWQAAATPWVVFLDDDVVPDTDWLSRLADDLAGVGPEVGAIPAHLRMRWSRLTLEGSTGDRAVRRDVLEVVDGFDERFTRPGCEDADLLLRIREHAQVVQGSRGSTARPSRRRIGLRRDAALMLLRHGRHWRDRAAQLAS